MPPAQTFPLAFDCSLPPDVAATAVTRALAQAEDDYVRERLAGIPATLADVAEASIRRTLADDRAAATAAFDAARQQLATLTAAVTATTPKVQAAEAALAKARAKAAELVRAPAAAWHEAVSARNTAAAALERFLDRDVRALVSDDERRLVFRVLDQTLEAARQKGRGREATAVAWRATLPGLIAATQACNDLSRVVFEAETTPLAWAAARLQEAARTYHEALEAARVAEVEAQLRSRDEARALVAARR